MSDLKDLTALGDSGAFPGHVLCVPRLLEYAEAEEEAAACYLRRIAKSAAQLPEPQRQLLHERAVDNLRANPFNFGSPAFDRWALSMSAMPFLAWLLLRIGKPEMTLAQAAALLNDGHNLTAKVNAVWNLWGYRAQKKAPAASHPPQAALPAGSGPSPGATSSTASPVPLPPAAACVTRMPSD